MRKEAVEESAYLYTTTTSETSDRRLCDTLDVVTKNLAMSLGSALSEALATFSACEDASVRCFEDAIEVEDQEGNVEDGGSTHVQS